MVYQQAHTGIIRKLFVEGGAHRRWGTVYIGATSCTVKRATRADLRLTPLSLRPSLPLSFSLSSSLRTPPAVVFALELSRSLFPSFPRSRSLARLYSPPPLSITPTLSRLSRRARSDAAQLPLAG